MPEITVPPTYKRGQSLKLTLSDGRLVNVVPPTGVEAGESFEWTVPTPDAPAAAPAPKGGLPALKKKLSFSKSGKKGDDEPTKKKSIFTRRPSFSSKSSTAQRGLLEDANKELKEAQEVVGDTTKNFYHAQAAAEVAAEKQKELEQEAAAAEARSHARTHARTHLPHRIAHCSSHAHQHNARHCLLAHLARSRPLSPSLLTHKAAAEQAKAAQIIQKQARKSVFASDGEKAAAAQAAESAQQASKKRAAATAAADEAAAKQAKAEEALETAHAARQASEEALEVSNDIEQVVRTRWLADNWMGLVMACVVLLAVAWYAYAVYVASAEEEIVVMPMLKPHQKVAKWVVRHVKKIKGPKAKAS